MILCFHKKLSFIYIFALSIAFFGGAVLFCMNSAYNPFYYTISADRDTYVFKTISMMIEGGYVPYKDSFDHKGPFLFVLNYLGDRISPYRGIWVIEVLFIAIAFIYMYKITRLFCNVGYSLLAVGISTSVLFEYYRADMTEEFAIPLIAIGIYYFLLYFMNKHLSSFHIVISGCCFSFVFLLRANMTAVWLVFCTFIFIELIKKKEYKELFRCVSFFLLGVIIVFTPFLVWFAINNAIFDFFKDYILFNKQYSTNMIEGSRNVWVGRVEGVVHFCKSSVVIIAYCSIFYFVKIKRDILDIVYIIFMVVSHLLMTMSGYISNHYGMILVPVVVYPISKLLSEVENDYFNSQHKYVAILITIALATTFVAPNWLNTLEDAVSMPYVDASNEDHLANEVVSIIESNTAEDEKISVYGNWNKIYVLSHRIHATRYSYQYPIGQVDPTIMDEYFDELQEEMPNIIVIESGFYDANISTFLNKNRYEQIFVDEGNENAEKAARVFARLEN